MILQLWTQIIGSSQSSDQKDSLYVGLSVSGQNSPVERTLIALVDFLDCSSMTLIMSCIAGLKKFAISALKHNNFQVHWLYGKHYLLSLTQPDRISYGISFSLWPKRTKHDFEDPLKFGFVVLSKNRVMTSISSGVLNLDPRGFSIQHN